MPPPLIILNLQHRAGYQGHCCQLLFLTKVIFPNKFRIYKQSPFYRYTYKMVIRLVRSQYTGAKIALGLTSTALWGTSKLAAKTKRREFFGLLNGHLF